MPLTDDEQRRLEEIAVDLRRSDADLELALSTGRLCTGPLPSERRWSRRLHRAGTSLVIVSFGCLVTALAVQQQLLCLGAWLVFMSGMVLRSLAG